MQCTKLACEYEDYSATQALHEVVERCAQPDDLRYAHKVRLSSHGFDRFYLNLGAKTQCARKVCTALSTTSCFPISRKIHVILQMYIDTMVGVRHVAVRAGRGESREDSVDSRPLDFQCQKCGMRTPPCTFSMLHVSKALVCVSLKPSPNITGRAGSPAAGPDAVFCHGMHVVVAGASRCIETQHAKSGAAC